jgi:hypothetical protein
MGVMKMGNDEIKKLDTRDLILATLYARDNKIRGRTVLQKLCYFVDEMLKLGIDYEPYFYGPFSEDVAISMDSLVALDFVDEESEALSSPTTEQPVFDRRVYKYQLSESGLKLIEGRKTKLDIYPRTKEIIQKLETSGLEIQDPMMLSVAAKTYHILKARKTKLDNHEISEIANSLGWKISEDMIEQVAQSLEKLDLIRRFDMIQS